MYPLWCPNFVLCKTAFLRAFKVPTMRHLVSPVVLRSVSPVDGWTIAFQANGPQGAWTTLWTGVDGPKRQPAHCPDHRDCPHPRAFAHAPHRAKGVTGSPYRVFMVTVTVNQEAGQLLRRGPSRIKNKVLMYQNSLLMSGFQGRSPYKPPPAVDRSTGRWAAEHAHMNPWRDPPLPCKTGF